MRGKTRVALILNAGDMLTEEYKLERFEVRKAELKEIGLEGFHLDLRKFFGKKEELKIEIGKYDAVLATGGNTFLLRRAMYDSGFDELIVPLIKKDKIVYGGWSAGSVIVSPTLIGLELADKPELVQEVYGKETLWDGLNLLPYAVVSHYRSDNPESPNTESMVEFFKEEGIPYKALSDGQVLIVDGKKEEVVN